MSLLMLSLLLGCAGNVPTATGDGLSGAAAEPPVQPIAPTEVPAPTSTPDAQSRAVQVAIEAFATELGVSADEIRLVSATPMTWPNSAMGCPEPGMNYLQVITAGFKVILAAGAIQADYRVNDGSLGPMIAVRCLAEPTPG
jgi:hypothetical protein